jgi:phosphomannomutase
VSTNDLITTAKAWLGAEPDDDIRDELASLIADAEAGRPDELAARFDGRLQFGTAGLRAAVAAGPMRMNRLVVRQAAAGLGRWLLDAEESGEIADAAGRGVVVAHDARRKSDLFADDTARVLAAMGIRTMLHPGVQPTPVLAWSITGPARPQASSSPRRTTRRPTTATRCISRPDRRSCRRSTPTSPNGSPASIR